jgi:hypothetical protein
MSVFVFIIFLGGFIKDKNIYSNQKEKEKREYTYYTIPKHKAKQKPKKS